MIREVRMWSVFAGTISVGLTAGVFAFYAHTLMPALHATDDRTFVTSFRAIDRQILNPWFIGGCFIGALACTAVAAVTNRGRPAGAWATGALAAYALAVVVTIAVHVPLNDAIKAVDASEVATASGAVRARFHETRWVVWNLARVASSMVSFVCLAWALVECGRSTGPG